MGRGASAAALADLSSDPLGTISEPRFRRVAAFIQEQTGIKMPEGKIHLVRGRLMRPARDRGYPSIDTYCDAILSGEADAGMLTEFINAITTNKTDFFREARHFDYLARVILPRLRRDAHGLIRCWSAAASNGMEPYTLAMVLADFIGDRTDLDFSILATDIDTRVLEEGRRGVYPVAALDPVPAPLRARFVAPARDPRRGEARIVPALRRKVAFARLNLIESHYPVGEPMDLILCRNVLIYFDRDLQAQVISRLCDCLRPGGHLMLGHSESVQGMNLPLVPVSSAVLRKKE